MSNQTCHVEHKPSDPKPFLDNGNLDFSAHAVGWIISGFFAAIGIGASFWLVHKHLTFYTWPHEQRHIVRILFMVPIYSVTSFGSYFFWTEAIYWQLLRACYEAFIIHSFFYLLIAYVGKDEDEVRVVFKDIDFKRGKSFWLFPLGWMRYRPKSGMDFLWLMKWCILQYTVIGPLSTVAAVATQYFNLYCVSSWSPVFSHIYLMGAISISVSVAMYCILQLYWPLREQLKPFKPVLKLFSIKAIVFLIFWQDIAISLFASFGVLKESEYWTTEQIEVGISSIITCFEMALFGFLHIKAFSYLPYRARADTLPLPEGMTEHDPSTPMCHRHVRTHRRDALKDVLDIRDIFREMGLGGKYMARKVRGLDGQNDRKEDLEEVMGIRRNERTMQEKRGDDDSETGSFVDLDARDQRMKEEMEDLEKNLARVKAMGQRTDQSSPRSNRSPNITAPSPSPRAYDWTPYDGGLDPEGRAVQGPPMYNTPSRWGSVHFPFAGGRPSHVPVPTHDFDDEYPRHVQYNQHPGYQSAPLPPPQVSYSPPARVEQPRRRTGPPRPTQITMPSPLSPARYPRAGLGVYQSLEEYQSPASMGVYHTSSPHRIPTIPYSTPRGSVIYHPSPTNQSPPRAVMSEAPPRQSSLPKSLDGHVPLPRHDLPPTPGSRISGRRVSALVQYFDDATFIQHSPPPSISVVKSGPLHPDLEAFQQFGGDLPEPSARPSKVEAPPLQRGHTVIRAWRKGVKPGEAQVVQRPEEEETADVTTGLLDDERQSSIQGSPGRPSTKFEFEEY